MFVLLVCLFFHFLSQSGEIITVVRFFNFICSIWVSDMDCFAYLFLCVFCIGGGMRVGHFGLACDHSSHPLYTQFCYIVLMLLGFTIKALPLHC